MKNLSLLMLLSIFIISCSDDNDISEENVECENAQAATESAKQAFENADNTNYEQLCLDYAEALNQQIIECGDEDGSLQSKIDQLGDCTFTVEPPVSNAEFYITGLFNGEPIIMQSGTTENYLLGCGGAYGISGDPGETIKRGYSVLLASSLPFNESPAGDISFDRFYEGPYVPPFEATFDPAFNTSFPVGNYGPSDEFDTQKGMRFEFYTKGPGEGKYYASTNGDQTNTVFTITESVSDNYVQSGETYYRQIVTGTFNCMLYSSNGDPIEVTDGTFRLRVVDDCL